MNKNLIFTILFLAFVLAGNCTYAQGIENVLTSPEKEAQVIDENQTNEFDDAIFSKKSEKEVEKASKQKQKEILKQEKEQKALEKKQEKEAKKLSKQQEKEALKQEKENSKQEEIEPNTKQEKSEITNEGFKTEAVEKKSEDQTEDVQKEETKNNDEIEEKPEEPEIQEDAAPKDDAVDNDETKEIQPQTNDNLNEAEKEVSMYRKNLTFEDIDKNAVSINEFLQFTDKQNEKFSVFYYKTVSKLNVYKKGIKNKEDEISAIQSGNFSAKTKGSKLSKLDKELDYLMSQRDEFYNKSLKKFNSLLTKKQAIKWELLQQMGYRFLPELD